MPLYTPWKLTGGVEVLLHSCLLTALDGDEWSALCRGCFVLVAVECEPEWAPEQVGTVSWRGKFSVTGNRIELLFFEHVECTVEVTWVLHSLTVRGILNASLFSITCCILCWSLLKSDLRNVHIFCSSKFIWRVFAYSRKAPASFVVYVCAFVCRHVSARVPLDGFAWNVILETSVKLVEKIQVWVKADKKYRALDVNT